MILVRARWLEPALVHKQLNLLNLLRLSVLAEKRNILILLAFPRFMQQTLLLHKRHDSEGKKLSGLSLCTC